MTIPTLNRGLLLFTLTVTLLGCTKASELYCETDKDCQAQIRNGIAELGHLHCHPQNHACYPGCKTTADCAAYSGTVCHEGDCWKQSRWEDAGAPDRGTDTTVDQTRDVKRPPDTLRHPDLLLDPDLGVRGGEHCGETHPCITGPCINGICCAQENCPPCQKCKPIERGWAPDREAGTCVANTFLNGTNPKDACGTGICAGSCLDGKCAYPVKTCERTCDANILKVKKCATDNAACDVALPDQDCKANICSDKVDTCPTFCTEHGDCVTGVCDRTEAEANGEGRCVPASELIAPPADLAALSAAVDGITGEKTIQLKAIRYNGALTVSSGTVRLMGLTHPSGPGPHAQLDQLIVKAGAIVFVQGLVLTDAAGPVQCSGELNSPARLTIVESTIGPSFSLPGLSATHCHLTARRSTVKGNKGGGLLLSFGTFVLTNNLIVDNGTASGGFGGVSIPDATSVTFINNTVADNQAAATGGVGGVRCPGFPVVTLVNSIITSLSGATTKDCTLDAVSKTTTACNLDSAYKPTVGGCFDQAAPTTVTGLVWDFDRTPRVKGGSVDLGAYEIK